jgi:PAS domain S-box-containing protein
MKESENSTDAASLERALDSSIDGVAILDDDGRYRYVNQAHSDLYGFENPERLLGERWTCLYNDSEVERFERDIMPTLREQRNWRGTATGRRRDGQTFPQELSLTLLSKGGIICVVRDITQRMERRETLEHYETVLEHIRDGVYTLDTEGTITWVNQTAVEEFDLGYSRDELVGSPVSKVLGKEDIQQCLSIIQDLVTSDREGSGRCEVSLQTAHDTEISCELHLTLLRDGTGSVDGTVGVIRDITERKRHEQRLAVLNRVLRHNLRNELNVIMGRAEWLATTLDGEFVDAAETIVETAERLAALGEKARTIETNLQRESSHQTTIDIVPVVENCCEAVSDDYPDASLAVDTPDTQAVIADETIETVVENLVENALKHAGDSPTVRVSVTAAENSDNLVRLRVADDGPGIPREQIEAIRTREETQMVHGTGLGLWVVYWLVDSYGGELAFEGTGDNGTTVVVLLRPGSI